MEYIAFGEVLFEEHSSSFSSPYLFNGKELDRETNLSYYGARYLDMKTSLWLSTDDYKEIYPNISSYVYAANNPINIIDPDGKFLMDVHRRITDNAFTGSAKGRTYGSVYDHKELKYKMFALVSKDTEQFRNAITGGASNYSGSVVARDVRSLPWYAGGSGKPSVDSNHFDNMNYSQINSNFASINQGIDNSLSKYKNGKINAKQLGGIVGEFYHAIEDFYSHSNYIELYEKTFGQTSIDKIPTYSDVLSDAKYKDFANLLKKELHTGEYPGEGNNSYKMMNHDLGAGSQYDFVGQVKDKSVNWNSRAAEAVATKAVIQYNNKVESQIK